MNKKNRTLIYWRPEFFDDVERQANREFARAIEAAHGIKGEA